MNEIKFFVSGIPRPGGSKRVFPIRKGGQLTGKFIVTDAAGQANKDWRASVAHEGKLCLGNPDYADSLYFGSMTVPIEIELHFVLPRPKGHIKGEAIDGSLVTLKKSAPEHHTSRPDTGKLARSTVDALTHILWVDDSQIVKETHSKAYGSRPGVTVIVREARNGEAI
jgi:Holliday junction resolvase RusA-like endonuclease